MGKEFPNIGYLEHALEDNLCAPGRHISLAHEHLVLSGTLVVQV